MEGSKALVFNESLFNHYPFFVAQNDQVIYGKNMHFFAYIYPGKNHVTLFLMFRLRASVVVVATFLWCASIVAASDPVLNDLTKTALMV